MTPRDSAFIHATVLPFVKILTQLPLRIGLTTDAFWHMLLKLLL